MEGSHHEPRRGAPTQVVGGWRGVAPLGVKPTAVGAGGQVTGLEAMLYKDIPSQMLTDVQLIYLSLDLRCIFIR